MKKIFHELNQLKSLRSPQMQPPERIGNVKLSSSFPTSVAFSNSQIEITTKTSQKRMKERGHTQRFRDTSHEARNYADNSQTHPTTGRQTRNACIAQHGLHALPHGAVVNTRTGYTACPIPGGPSPTDSRYQPAPK